MTPREATMEALSKLPDGVWPAFLYAIRGVNLMLGNYILDDPTPCEVLEESIKAELDEYAGDQGEGP